MSPRRVVPFIIILLVSLLVVLLAAARPRADHRLQQAIDRLIKRPLGPPGAIVLVQHGSHLTPGWGERVVG